MSEARKRANAKYNAKKPYDRLEIIVKKGSKDDLKAHAAECGESLNGFVNRAIKEAMERDKSLSVITPKLLPVEGAVASGD